MERKERPRLQNGGQEEKVDSGHVGGRTRDAPRSIKTVGMFGQLHYTCCC